MMFNKVIFSCCIFLLFFSSCKQKKQTFGEPINTEKSSQPNVLFAANQNEIKMQFLQKIAEDFQDANPIRLHTIWVGICGNDEEYFDGADELRSYQADFSFEKQSYTLPTTTDSPTTMRTIIIDEVENIEEENYLKKYPKSIFLTTEVSDQNVIFRLKRDKKNEEYTFQIIWKGSN